MTSKNLLQRAQSTSRSRRIFACAMTFVLFSGVISVFTVARATESSLTIFGSVTPTRVSDPESASIELGTKFTAIRAGVITGVRFYKSKANTGAHTGSLWSKSGKLLATVTFRKETSSGWQTANFSKPVAVTPNQTYVVSYHTNVGHYASDEYFFAGKGAGMWAVRALADGADGVNGVYKYGNSSFPTSSYRSTNYYVDVVFRGTSTTATTKAPTTTKPSTATTKKPATTTTTKKPAATTTTTKPVTTPPPINGSVPCALNAAAQACWAANTGVPGYTEAQILAGQSPLQHVTGDINVTTDGTVIHDKWIDGCISVQASNVSIYNVLVRSSHGCNGGKTHSIGAVISTGDNGGGGIHGLVVRDSEINGLNGAEHGVAQTEYTCIRCDIHNVGKGAKGDQNVTVQDSYIHDLTNDGVSHTENFFYDGGNGNIKVLHNWMKANQSYSTGAVSFNNDWPGHYGTVDSNYLEGGGGAGFTGGAMGKNNPTMDHIVVTNNALSPNNGWGGTQFAYGYDPNQVGNVWTNNYNSETHAQLGAPGPS